MNQSTAYHEHKYGKYNVGETEQRFLTLFLTLLYANCLVRLT